VFVLFPGSDEGPQNPMAHPELRKPNVLAVISSSGALFANFPDRYLDFWAVRSGALGPT
jgi:hypothetical protein